MFLPRDGRGAHELPQNWMRVRTNVGVCPVLPHSGSLPPGTHILTPPLCLQSQSALCVGSCSVSLPAPLTGLPQPMLTKGQRGNAVGQAVRSRCPLPRGGHPRCLPRCPGSADSTTSAPPRSSPPHTTSWPGEASGSKSPLPREIEMGHTGHTATLGSAL